MDEVSEKELRECAKIVADTVARKYVNNTASGIEERIDMYPSKKHEFKLLWELMGMIHEIQENVIIMKN